MKKLFYLFLNFLTILEFSGCVTLAVSNKNFNEKSKSYYDNSFTHSIYCSEIDPLREFGYEKNELANLLGDNITCYKAEASGNGFNSKTEVVNATVDAAAIVGENLGFRYFGTTQSVIDSKVSPVKSYRRVGGHYDAFGIYQSDYDFVYDGDSVTKYSANVYVFFFNNKETIRLIREIGITHIYDLQNYEYANRWEWYD